MSPIPAKGLVLGFSGTAPGEIAAGVKTLGEVLEGLSPVPAPASPGLHHTLVHAGRRFG